MGGSVNETQLQRAARIAGASWLIIILTGIAAEFFIRMPLMVPDDPVETARNIAASAGLFRTGIAADIVMLIFDAVAAVTLYVVFYSVNKSLALAAMVFRLIMNAVLAVNLLNLVNVLAIAQGMEGHPAADAMMLQLFLDAHGAGYDVALVFFGLHCLLLGYLIYVSGYVPKLAGILLLFASLGYVIDSFAHLLLPQGSPLLAMTAGALIAVAVLAELSLSLWLMVKGVKTELKRGDSSIGV